MGTVRSPEAEPRDIAASRRSSCCFLPGTGATVTHLARPRRRLESSATLGRARPPPVSPPQGHTYAVATSGLATDRVTIGTLAERDTDLSAAFCEPTVLAKQGLRVPVAGPGTRESPQERPGSPRGPVPTPVSAQHCVRPGLPSLTPGLARQWHGVGCPVCPLAGNASCDDTGESHLLPGVSAMRGRGLPMWKKMPGTPSLNHPAVGAAVTMISHEKKPFLFFFELLCFLHIEKV